MLLPYSLPIGERCKSWVDNIHFRQDITGMARAMKMAIKQSIAYLTQRSGFYP